MNSMNMEGDINSIFLMEMNEIKADFVDEDPRICPTCLSSGRRLKPLAELEDMFTKVMGEFLYKVPFIIRRNTIEICWECRALLEKAMQFQLKFKKSCKYFQKRLQHLNTLTNLGAVTFDEEHYHSYIYDERDFKDDTSDAKHVDNETIKIKTEEKSDDETYGEETFFEETHCEETSEGKIKIDFEEIKTENNDDTNVKIEKENKKKKRVKKDLIQNGKGKTKKDKKKQINGDAKNKTKNDNKVNNETDEEYELENTSKEIKLPPESKKYNVIKNYEDMIRKDEIDDLEFKKYVEKERHNEYYNSFDYKCTDCVKGFRMQRLLDAHIKYYHQNEGNFVCDKCTQRFSSEDKYTKHIKEHNILYICLVCAHESIHWDDIWDHVNDHRFPLQCKECMIMYEDRRDFFAHYKCMHETFYCDYCGIKRSSYSRIKDHIVIHHMPSPCPVCNRVFRNRKVCGVHKSTVHPKNPYKLKVKKPFVSKPVPCMKEGCGKIYWKRGNMLDHYNFVHLKSDKYKCDICPSRQMNKFALAKHKKRIHEGVKPPRVSTCNICGKSYYNIVILKNHMRTHSGLKPHCCPLCPATFAQVGSARLHFRKRHPDSLDNHELVKKLWSKDREAY